MALGAGEHKLVMISDGILEAADVNGKLFGFERVALLRANSTPVKAVAGAAQPSARSPISAS
jgi:hypothetical protein